MNKAFAIAELKTRPVGRFVEIVKNAEENNKDISDLFNQIVMDNDLDYVLSVFLNFSKKMLRSMSAFYNLEWSSYIDRFIDYANLIKMRGDVH